MFRNFRYKNVYINDNIISYYANKTRKIGEFDIIGFHKTIHEMTNKIYSIHKHKSIVDLNEYTDKTKVNGRVVPYNDYTVIRSIAYHPIRQLYSNHITLYTEVAKPIKKPNGDYPLLIDAFCSMSNEYIGIFNVKYRVY